VQDIFYNLFDKGSIKDGEGRNIDFRNTLIVMTTNAGEQRLQALTSDQSGRPEHANLLEQLRPDLLRHFRPAFLGRCTPLVYFPLEEAQLKQISELNLQRIARRLREHYDATFDYGDCARQQLVERSRHSDTGARNIEHMVANALLPQLAGMCLQKIAAGQPINHARLHVDAAGDFQFEVG
jgi:type VI secretion system protein VasG